MSAKVAFISLGCAKNRVNTEQMMSLCQSRGYTVQGDVEGCDAVVVNTCGFLSSACQEAVDVIIEMGELKKAGVVGKILVTGCLSQRYREDILEELPEVDGVLGTGSYALVADALAEILDGGLRPCHIGDIHTAPQGGPRILSTPPWYAYLRIAEGCDNHCAYCLIPSLRGRYRSRPMDEVLAEAAELASAGVRELLVVAQDVTRYGADLSGTPQLAALVKELCKLDFHWIRLHYLYPDEITDELIDVVAAEPKVVKYLDIPIQHCSDAILKAMNRRDTGAGLAALFEKLRARIPGLVLRTSLIAGLPGEDAAAFEELCAFLRAQKIERAGVFPFSPEEGTRAAAMARPEAGEAARRAELLVDVQSEIIDAYNESRLGETVEVLCEGWDGERYYGRSYAESPEIDGRVWFTSEREAPAGSFVSVRLTGTMDGEITGEEVL